MKPKGLSKDAGWMAGARRTFSITPPDAWKVITSEEALRLWLGDLPGFRLAKGAPYTLADGTHGRVTTFAAGSHFRMTWQPADYPRPTILQVRIIPSGDKTVIAFHQEHLPDAGARAERKAHFQRVLDRFLNYY